MKESVAIEVQEKDGMRDIVLSGGLGEEYKRQACKKASKGNKKTENA